MRESQNRIGSKTAYPYDVFRLDVVDWCGGLSRFGPCRLYPLAISTISWHIKGVWKVASWMRIQLLHFLQQFKRKGLGRLRDKLPTTTLI